MASTTTPAATRDGSSEAVAQRHPRARRAYASGKLAPLPAQRAQQLWSLILHHLKKEWPAIRAVNLGVQSGTAVLGELLLRDVHAWVQELHMLTVTEDDAAAVVCKAAQHLPREEMQQLQVLLDVLNHDHLSDFLRLAVFNVRSPFVTQPVDVVTDKKLKAIRRKQHRKQVAKQAAAAAAEEEKLQQSNPLLSKASVHSGARPEREETIRRVCFPKPPRFAGYLPGAHPLVQQAYRIYMSRLPPDPPAETDDAGAGAGGAGRKAYGRRYGPDNSMHEARLAAEAARNIPPELVPWLDVEQRWQRTCHTHQRPSLTNPIMVSEPTPLYGNVPDFKRRVEEAAEARAQARARAEQALQANMGTTLGRSRAPYSRQASAAASRASRSGAATPTLVPPASPAAGQTATNNRTMQTQSLSSQLPAATVTWAGQLEALPSLPVLPSSNGGAATVAQTTRRGIVFKDDSGQLDATDAAVALPLQRSASRLSQTSMA